MGHNAGWLRWRWATSRRCTMARMSDAAHSAEETHPGVGLLPRDLTEEQLAAAPVLASVDTLLIEDLDEDEDEAFAAALAS